jgi:hypothetical protein
MARSSSFTYEQGLLRQLTEKGWFANPAGIEGHVVLVLERRGKDGTNLHCILQPGEALRLDERLLGRYEAYAVDIRQGRSFPVSGQFAAADSLRNVSLRANVRYRAIDARKVALETVDPLGALRDMVIATLGEQLARYPMGQITRDLCTKIIASVGYQEHLGLTVEGADILEFSHDQKVIDRMAEHEDLRHQIATGELQQQAEIGARVRQEQAEMQIQQMWIEGVDLRDPNALMRQHPELVPNIVERLDQRDRLIFERQFAFEADRREVLKGIINAYVQQELSEGGVLDLDALARFVEERLGAPGLTAGTGTEQQRIGFGESLDSLPGRIEFGEETGEAASDQKRIEFGEPGEPEKE